MLVRCAVGILLAVTGGAVLAQAPKYPSKPVRMLVGFAPGGATDNVARYISTGLTEALGHSVIVENRPGASSLIAGELVAKAPPDGHTVLMTTQTLMPGFEVVGFFGVLAPAGTPREIVARLNSEIAKVLARPDIKERFASQALEPGNKTPEQFSDYIKSEAGKWGKLIRDAGIS